MSNKIDNTERAHMQYSTMIRYYLAIILTVAVIVLIQLAYLSKRTYVVEQKPISAARKLTGMNFTRINLYDGDSLPLQRQISNHTCDISFACMKTLKEYIYKGWQTLLEKNDNGYVLCNVTNSSQPSTINRAKPQPDLVVPNIAHYVWFGNSTFRFDHLISLLSAHRIMKAEKIMFHTDSEPTGKYWLEAKDSIPNLKILHREMPMTVFNYSLKKADIRHRSDISRLEILFQYGGVYMDNDVIVVRPLDELRHYDCVLGREGSTRVNNGIILARKYSLFIKLYLDSYRVYNRFCWNCDSIQFPNTLAKQCPRTVHVDKGHLIVDGALNEIFWGNFNWTDGYFTVHTFIRWAFGLPEDEDKSINFSADSIKNLSTPFGEMCRFVYYGSRDIIGT